MIVAGIDFAKPNTGDLTAVIVCATTLNGVVVVARDEIRKPSKQTHLEFRADVIRKLKTEYPNILIVEEK